MYFKDWGILKTRDNRLNFAEDQNRTMEERGEKRSLNYGGNNKTMGESDDK